MDEIIESKLVADTEFQNSLKDLPDDEKNTLIESKKIEILRAEAPALLEAKKKAEELAGNQKVRAEKAEGELKKLKPTEVKDDNNLSSKDMFALIEAKVPQDDVDEVAEYAKFKGISVTEALKSSVVKATLAEKAESRRTVNAMNLRSTRQSSKLDGQAILNDAKTKGEEGIPNPGSSEAEEMFWAKRGGRK